jgi:3-phenylpropionate/cinnamic acid dioxygenase small subunit
MNRPHPDGAVHFVLDEARALNERRYEDWLGMFAIDGRYWVPLQGDAQPGDACVVSLADEDRVLLAIRIERLKSSRAWSMESGVASLHVVQQPMVVARDLQDDDIHLVTPFTYVETKAGRQTLLAGTWKHRLVAEAGGWKIALKRVDLLNAGAAHEAIHLFP